MKIFKRLLPMIVILIFELAVGVLLLINGEATTHIIFLIFGILLLVGGLVTLIRAIIVGRSANGGISMLALVAAIVMIGFGAFFIAAAANVDAFMAFVAVIFGIIMAVNGAFKLAEYAAIRKAGAVNSFIIIGAIITIILGIVIAFNPFGAEMMYIIFGIMIIVSAVLDVISLILFGQALKEIEDSVE